MKIFGIGMQRTGTSSLARALNLLEVKTLQFPKELYFDIDDPIIQEYDGFTDNPIPLLYRELDRRHPSSKFIHVVRDEDSWISSVRWLFSTGSVKFDWQNNEFADTFHRQLYGTTQFDEDLFREIYRRYNQDVTEYFADRPDSLLALNLEQGLDFKVLCAFLGKPEPQEEFPALNKREPLWRVKLGKLRRRLKVWS